MKFLDKLGLAVFSLIVLTFSILICLISFGWVDISVIVVALNTIYSTENGVYIMTIILVILIFLAIKCLFFPSWEKHKNSSDDDEGILLQNENGKLLITKGTIKNLVASVVEESKEIEDATSDVEIDSNNDVCVNLSINVLKGAVIKNVSTKLQDSIKTSVKKATDLEIKEINIKVKDVENISDKETVKNNESED